METYLKIGRLWTWPIVVAAAVLMGFAIRGSDLPAAATWLSGLFALLAALAFWLTGPGFPSLAERIEVWRAAFVLGVFGLAIWVPPLIAMCLPVSARGVSFFDPSATFLESLKLCGVSCAFLLGLRLSASDDQARRLLDAVLYVCGLWAVASIFMFILDPAGIYGELKFGAGRLTGAFSSPNSAGTLFGAAAVMAMGRVLNRLLTQVHTPIFERLDPAMTIVATACLAALLLTVSRGAFFATLIAGLAMCLFMVRGRVPWPVMVAVGVLGLVLLGLLFATPMSGILARLDDVRGDAAVRATIFKSHLAFASKQPIFGTGLGSFNTVNTHIVRSENYGDLSVIRAMHNVYLQWFEETGLIGLLSLVALNLSVLVPIVYASIRRVHMAGRLMAILAGYAVFLLHGFTDYGFQEPALALFAALILGCGFGISGNKTPVSRRSTKQNAVKE